MFSSSPPLISSAAAAAAAAAAVATGRGRGVVDAVVCADVLIAIDVDMDGGGLREGVLVSLIRFPFLPSDLLLILLLVLLDNVSAAACVFGTALALPDVSDPAIRTSGDEDENDGGDEDGGDDEPTSGEVPVLELHTGEAFEAPEDEVDEKAGMTTAVARAVAVAFLFASTLLWCFVGVDAGTNKGTDTGASVSFEPDFGPFNGATALAPSLPSTLASARPSGPASLRRALYRCCSALRGCSSSCGRLFWHGRDGVSAHTSSLSALPSCLVLSSAFRSLT